jgi:hypothetical protein
MKASVANLIAKVSKSKVPAQRGQTIPAGEHLLVLRSFECIPTRDYGNMFKASFVVDESGTLTPGAIVEHVWLVEAQGLNGEYNRGFARGFVQELLGLAAEDEFPAEILEDHQPGRGVRIKCRAYETADKNDPEKTRTRHVWAHLPQTAEQVASARATIERDYPVRNAASTEDDAPALAAPAPAAAPPKPSLTGFGFKK